MTLLGPSRQPSPEGERHPSPLDGSGGHVAPSGARGTVPPDPAVVGRSPTLPLVQQLAAIVQSSQDAIVGLDPQGTILSWNAAAERLYGHSEPDAVGRSLAILLPPERAGELELLLARVRAGEPVASFETTLRRRDGQPVDVALTVSPIRGEDGAVVGASTIARDVTERRRDEATLRQSEQRYRTLVHTILDTAVDGIVTIDAEGRVESINRSALRMFGYEEPEVLGQDVGLLMPAPERDEHTDHIRRYLRTGEPHVIGQGREMRGRHKDGRTFPLEITVSEVRLDDRRLFTGILRDVTESRRLEEELRQSQKMEAIGRLAGGIAHDFNNLLMGLIGFCRIAAGQLPEGSPALPYIEDIKAEAERGAARTHQLLAFSRRRPAEPRPVAVDALMAERESLLRQLLTEDIDLRLELDPAAGTIRADPDQIEQVLMNLVVNARDAMPQGGRLVLRAGAGCCARGPAEGCGGCVELSVEDTGCGMDEATRAHIFEPFFTTKEVGEGTGLGLSTVYGIVHGLGGHLHVASEPGRGARFDVHLPRAMPAPARPAPLSADGPPAAPGAATILVVEDERLVRISLRHILEDLGHAVLLAADAEQARELVAEHGEAIDLLLTDVALPGLAGPELVEQLRQARPDLRVIYMSAYPAELLLEQGRIRPGDPALHKPFADEELADMLHTVLRAGG